MKATGLARICIAVFAIGMLLALGPGTGRAQKETPRQTPDIPPVTAPGLVPAWTDGILSDGVGPAGIFVTNLTAGPTKAVVACVLGSVYVLEKAATGSGYDTVFYSENVDCSKVAVGDRDGDGVREIYAGTNDSRVVIFRGDTFAVAATLTLTGTGPVTGVAVANVDTDPAQEIVVTRSDTTLIYNAISLALEWQATGKGGNAVAVGQIDSDARVEVVVNGNPAHILDPTNQIEKWAYSGGFGISMSLGDVQGDGKDEIAYVVGGGYTNSTLYLFDAATQSVLWSVGPSFGMQIVLIGDTVGDTLPEVITGDGQWGSVRGFRGSDGGSLWAIGNPEHGVFGLATGDSDNDGTIEVLWGAGLTSSGTDALFVGNPVTQSLEWQTEDLDGPFYVAAGDVDNDGTSEIVAATARSESGYEGGAIRVYDGVTHELEWNAVHLGPILWTTHLNVGQLDADPQLEILLGTSYLYDTVLVAYDGLTHALEWTSPVIGSDGPRAMITRNIDADAVDEIIVAVAQEQYGPYVVQVYNGAGNVIQWESGPLDSAPTSMSIGDLDGNSTLELAVLTGQNIYVYDTSGWTQRLQRSFTGGLAVGVVRGNAAGPGQMLLATQSRLEAWNGSTFTSLWQMPLVDVNTRAIVAGEVDGNAGQEFVLVGQAGVFGGGTVTRIGSPLRSGWLFSRPGNWNGVFAAALADVDGDSANELLLGTGSMVHLDEIEQGACNIVFADLPETNTFYPFVTCLACRDIIAGYVCGSDGEQCNHYNDPYFRPNNNITRGQIAKIVALSSGINDPVPGGQRTFEDVPLNSAFYLYIERLAGRGVMSGYACGQAGEPCVPPANRPYFRPYGDATRGQLTKIVSNAAEFTNTIPPTQQTFSDVPPGSTFHVFVERLLLNRPGVMGGYTCGSVPSEPCDPQNRPYFRPNNSLTRGQTSKIVANTFFPSCGPTE